MSADLMQHLTPFQQGSARRCEECGCETCADALWHLTEIAKLRRNLEHAQKNNEEKENEE